MRNCFARNATSSPNKSKDQAQTASAQGALGLSPNTQGDGEETKLQRQLPTKDRLGKILKPRILNRRRELSSKVWCGLSNKVFWIRTKNQRCGALTHSSTRRLKHRKQKKWEQAQQRKTNFSQDSSTITGESEMPSYGPPLKKTQRKAIEKQMEEQEERIKKAGNEETRPKKKGRHCRRKWTACENSETWHRRKQ